MSGQPTWLLAAALVTCATSSSAAPPSAEKPKGHFAGWSEVDASGRLTAFTPDGPSVPAVAQAVRGELDRQVFTPARDASGSPQRARTFLSGAYALEPLGDDWILRITELWAGPKPTGRVMPRPPQRTFSGGEPVWMRVAMTVQADGRPTNIVIEEWQGPQAFLREARDAFRKWRFEPESVGGQPIATTIRQDYSISLGEITPPAGPSCPQDTSGRVLAPGQTSCFPEIEITLSKRLDRGRNHISVP